MTSDLDLVGERNENYVNLVTQRAGIATGSAERLPVKLGDKTHGFQGFGILQIRSVSE